MGRGEVFGDQEVMTNSRRVTTVSCISETGALYTIPLTEVFKKMELMKEYESIQLLINYSKEKASHRQNQLMGIKSSRSQIARSPAQNTAAHQQQLLSTSLHVPARPVISSSSLTNLASSQANKQGTQLNRAPYLAVDEPKSPQALADNYIPVEHASNFQLSPTTAEGDPLRGADGHLRHRNYSIQHSPR